MNSRRIRTALKPLLGERHLSKSAVSRIVGWLKALFTTWRDRDLSTERCPIIFLDGFHLNVRGKSQGALPESRAGRDETQYYHRIIYAGDGLAARAAYDAFVKKWAALCPAVAKPLEEADLELQSQQGGKVVNRSAGWLRDPSNFHKIRDGPDRHST